MFNLTDGEEKLCWLFFICAKWRQAQNYFMDHIELNDFSRRPHLLTVLDMDHREFSDILSGKIISNWVMILLTFMNPRHNG